ncbi:hypothetical protein OG331_22590 [Streptomyces sp. NBC_01017]|uniref:hypothetical protein n=1 Tax=Streptomyces sp. NBC_01017 TaxID=2903721 RepID=UPI00386BAB9A|nr:hypothetical protein OG331_22590 [Streptomyces sp. NBC_01017]
MTHISRFVSQMLGWTRFAQTLDVLAVQPLAGDIRPVGQPVGVPPQPDPSCTRSRRTVALWPPAGRAMRLNDRDAPTRLAIKPPVGRHLGGHDEPRGERA